MISKPSLEDVKLIGWGIVRVILGLGIIMAIPLAVAAFSAEWDVVVDFAIGIFVCVVF